MNKKTLICKFWLACMTGGAMAAAAVAQQLPVPAATAAATDKVIADLVAASRILADLNVMDGFGHVSARHPSHPDHFLMSRSKAPATVTAEDIVEHDQDGNGIDANGRGLFLERYIHSEIYRTRPDVMAIVHSHSPGVVPFSVSQTPLRPVYHNSAFLGAGVPVFEIRQTAGMSDMLIRNAQIGKALAAVLADKPVVLLRGHGDVVVGPSLPIVVFRAYYTEVNARLQQQAIALGPVTYLEPEEARIADKVNEQVVMRPWDLWKKKVGEKQPSP